MKFHQCEIKKKKKYASNLKSPKFIMPRGIQDSSKREFIKKGKDSSSIERCKCIKMTLAEKNREGKRSPKVHSIKRLKT